MDKLEKTIKKGHVAKVLGTVVISLPFFVGLFSISILFMVAIFSGGSLDKTFLLREAMCFALVIVSGVFLKKQNAVEENDKKSMLLYQIIMIVVDFAVLCVFHQGDFTKLMEPTVINFVFLAVFVLFLVMLVMVLTLEKVSDEDYLAYKKKHAVPQKKTQVYPGRKNKF